MPITIRAGFELVGPPKQSGLVEAELNPQGDLLAIRLLDASESLSEEEKAQILANLSDLFSKVGTDLIRDLKPEVLEEAATETPTTH